MGGGAELKVQDGKLDKVDTNKYKTSISWQKRNNTGRTVYLSGTQIYIQHIGLIHVALFHCH